MALQIFLIVFIVCAFIQLVYHLIFIFVFAKYKTEAVSVAPPVSVVICAHDEEENLRKLLPVLYAQDHPDYEIIVVEERSNDGTYDLLLEETKKEPRLKMVKVNHTPDHFNAKKYGLTLGIKAAQHDIILLTDADCLPDNEQWITSMAKGFNAKTQINLGFSAYQKTGGFLNAFIRFETLWTALQYIGLALAGRPYMGVGRNLAYRKSLFLSKKGFTPYLGLTGGDDDLFVNQHAKKNNTNVIIGKSALVYSWPKTTWSAFFRQKLRHLSVGKFYTAGDKIILSLFTFTQIFFWLTLAILPAYGIELYIVAGGFLVRLLLSYGMFITACRRLGIKFDFWGLIFLELFFIVYFIITGTTALFTKRVRWS